MAVQRRGSASSPILAAAVGCLLFAGWPGPGSRVVFASEDSSAYAWCDSPVSGRFFTVFDVATPEQLPNVTNFNPSGHRILAGELVDGSVYMIDAVETLWEVDPATGTILRTLFAQPLASGVYTGLALDPTTGMVFAAATSGSSSSLLTLDLETGAASSPSAVAGSPDLRAIAIDGAGDLYGIDPILDSLLVVDKNTGAATVIGPLGFDAFESDQGLSWDRLTDTLYLTAINADASRSELRTVDRASGGTSLVGVLGSATPGGFVNFVPWLALDVLGPATGPLFSGTAINAQGTLHAAYSSEVTTGEAAPVVFGRAVWGATYDADGQRVLFTSDGGAVGGADLYVWPISGGLPTLAGTITHSGAPFRIDGLAISNGVLYGSRAEAGPEDGLYEIDPLTLTATLVLAFNGSISGIDADPTTGAIFGVNDTAQELVEIDPVAGTVTTIAAYPQADDLDGLAVGGGRAYLVPDGPVPGFIYVYDFASQSFLAPLPAPWTVSEHLAGAAFIEDLSFLFRDGFESGDTSAWSMAVP